MSAEQDPHSERSRLQPGVWGVLATPFSVDASEVDTESLRQLVDFYVDLGVTGLTLLGVSGEALYLTPEERRLVVKTAVGRPGVDSLVLGVTSRDTDEAVAEIVNVADVAGDRLAAFMVQVNDGDPDAVIAHLRELHLKTEAPVILQDHPRASNVEIATTDLARVVRDCDFVVGIKLESPPTPLAITQLVGEVTVPILGGLGGTNLLGELLAGSSGAMTGFSVPEGLLECIEAYRSDGFQAAKDAWLPYAPLAAYESQPGISNTLRKEALRLRGLIEHSVTRSEEQALPQGLLDGIRLHLEAALVTPGTVAVEI